MLKTIFRNTFHLDNTVGTLNSTVRTEWIKKKLEHLKPGLRILDAGSGTQPYKQFCKHLIYVSQDFDSYNSNENSIGIHPANWEYSKTDIVCDIINIPEPEQSFDVILCSEVIEHIPNPVKALEEFKRLLKKSGILIITAPFCSLTHFAPYHFATGFNSFFYEHHLNKLGFEIIEIQHNGNYFEYLAQEIRRLPVIQEKYTNQKRKISDKLAIRLIINLLGKLSKNQSKSEELLNFGFHVLAILK
jgi:ubiquinone/menaquinone biosynthesis C-methylase UbiE